MGLWQKLFGPRERAVSTVLVGLAMFGLAAADRCAAQQPADSVRPPAADSTRPPSADSARPPASDSGARPAADTAPARAPQPQAVAPADSTLTAACRGTRTGGLAANILVVIFRPDAPKEELAAVAKAVGGKLVGTVPSGEGSAYYLQVPAEGDEQRLGATADQVIRYPPVQQVSPAVCPATPRADTAQPPP
jgi:hypothetical protein